MIARKPYLWKLASRGLQLGERTLLMGIVNVTPDSFSDGGNFLDPDRAYAHALELELAGADIIDIGAESTRPGSARISEEEELRRLAPVLKRLRGKLTIPVSVDTYKAAVAERAIELGAEIINDPSNLTFDPELAKTALRHDAGLVLNHMRGTPETWARLAPVPDPMSLIAADLLASVHKARRVGVEPTRIVIDPGLGFGKRKEENSRTLAHMDRLTALDLPVLVGPSRKSFLAQQSPEDTLMASAAAVTTAILMGAHIVRVHEVAAMAPVARVADAIVRSL
ncbi:MAG: dihydropteroate synthase [Bryobacteraceae bacterium]